MDKITKQKRLALLDETVEYYSTHNRSTVLKPDGTKSLCSYVATEGNDGCAIGRKINPELREKLQEKNYSVSEDNAFDSLPVELKELGQMFLAELQRLHDGADLWHEIDKNKNALTEKGIARYNYIKMQFC